MADKAKVRVAIIGAGISGLALANSLLLDKDQRFEVKVYERDDSLFKEDRQGYLLTICDTGLTSLRYSTGTAGWEAFNQVWSEESNKGAALIDPKTGKLHCQLGEVRFYPDFRRISRQNLRGVLRRLPEKERCIRYKCSLDNIEMLTTDSEQRHEVKLTFRDPHQNPPAIADIVVAADGSYSRAYELLNLQSKYELTEWARIQMRADIDEDTIKELPQLFFETGRSWLYLGGSKLGGFVNAIPVEPSGALDCRGSSKLSESKTALHRDPQDVFRLFCDFQMPRAVGDRIFKEAKGDEGTLIELVCSYVTEELKYDSAGVPAFLRAAAGHVRTGRLTSSREPADRDWRSKRSPGWGRIILIGDAIHPMTPGRGMGANQALGDAHRLSLLLHEFADRALGVDSTPAHHFSDQDALDLARTFDDEMYVRAFDMVKQSEQSMLYDLTSISGRVKLRAALALFEASHSATSFASRFFGRLAKPS